MRQAQKIKENIEYQIVTGAFRPGDRLDEATLAAQFKISRTPVREAIMMLESIDLVERRPRQGAFVKGLSLTRLVQMFEVLAEFEATASRLAARRIHEKEKQALIKSHKECLAKSKMKDARKYYDANLKFHQNIFRCAHNDVLCEQISNIGRRLEPFLRAEHRQPGWIERSVTEHQVILDNILNGDGEQASKTMREHIHLDSEIFMEFVSSQSYRFSEN